MNIDQARRKIISKRSRQKGNHGEAIARHALTSLGIKQLCKIETGWRIKRGVGGKIIGATPIGKVAGDFRGITKEGRSVMVEVKERDDSLVWSDIENHQHEALAEHATLGGLSLIAVVFTSHIALIKYPNFKFLPKGKGITPKDTRDYIISPFIIGEKRYSVGLL